MGSQNLPLIGLTGIGGVVKDKGLDGFMDDVLGMEQPPEPPELPPEIDTIDANATREMSRKRAKQRKGRSSTILASKLGSSNSNKKTILG